MTQDGLIAELIRVLIFLAIVMAVYAGELFFIFRFIIRKLRGDKSSAGILTRPAVVFHMLSLAGILAIVYGHFIEPRWIEIKKIEIFTEKLKKTSVRIVQISDLHFEKTADPHRLSKLIKPYNPDLIVFTGDALNSFEALPVFKKALAELKAPLGKYAVLGNYDVGYFEGLDFFSDTGFTELEEDAVRLNKNGEFFYVYGFSYRFRKIDDRVFRDFPDNTFAIFLYHKPDLIERAEKAGYDLYLAGHTHGGQVAVPFYGALITFSKYGKQFESGLRIYGNTNVYVNKGIGLEKWPAPQVRFLARPEITVIDIHPKRNM